MVEPLLGLLLITLLAWAILLVGLPELLTWLARRNAQQRRQLIQAVRRLENDLTSLLRQLEPFRNLQAPQYRHTYEMITGLLANVQKSRHDLVTTNVLRFPHIPTVVWPVRHFASHPQDAAGIVATFRRLRRLQRSLAAGNRTLAEAQAHLEELQQMPEQLRQESEALLARLESVQAILQEEQRQGVVALGKWRAEQGRWQQSAQALRRRLGAAADISLEQADQLGQELDHVAAALTELEGGVQALQRDRLAFDARRGTVTAALAALGDLPPPLKPVADVVHTVLAETADLRRDLAFDQAEPLLKTGQQWIELGRTFQSTEALVGQLLRLRDDSLDPAAINQVSSQLQRAYQSLASLNVLAGRRPYTPLPAHIVSTVTSLVATLAQIQKQAASVQEQYKREAREQEQIVKGRAHELVRAWNTLRRIIKLNNNEPLAKRYHSLLEQRPAANGRPAQLRAWALRAAELQHDILESAGYLQYRLNLIAEWMNQLSGFLRELDTNEATAWHCLQQQVAEIKQTGLALQQLWKEARGTGWLDETHERLDNVKLHYQKLQQDYEAMDRYLYQLNQMDGRIEETIGVVQQTADNIDPMTLSRMMELVTSNQQRAFEASTCQEAIELLQRAETFANQLAMR